MKKSNVFGVVAALLLLFAIVSLISWFLINGNPTIIQGQVDVTSYKVSSKIPGRIDQMLVREGQKVEKGELLYVLSTPEVDAKMSQAQAVKSAAEAKNRMAINGARSEQIEGALNLWQKAQAGLVLAQKSYDRVKKLYEQGVVSAQKYDEAEANLNAMRATEQAAKSQYDMAVNGARKEDREAAQALVRQAEGVVSEVEAALGDACIYSPVDGEISTVIAEQGELIGAGYPVISVLDMNDMWVSFNIKEDLMPKIKMGTKFTGNVPALDKDVEFEVYYIAPQADYATWSATRTRGGFDIRTFNVKARAVSSVEDMRPGMSVTVDWDKIGE